MPISNSAVIDVGLGARRGAERRRRAARGNERDRVADVDAQHVGEARADGDAGCPRRSRRACRSGCCRRRAAARVRPSSVMPRTSAPVACTADETITWPSISGIADFDARHGGDALGDRVVVVERAADLVDDDVAVEAEDLGEQLVAEAVHHRHDDDQRRDAEHDAGEREAGDDGDEAFRAARAQIARGQHPLVGRERRYRAPSCGRGLAHCCRSCARHAASPPCPRCPPSRRDCAGSSLPR